MSNEEKNNNETFVSDFSNNIFNSSEMISGKAIHPAILKLIQKEKPEFKRDNKLSQSELNEYRQKYIFSVLSNEIGELSELERTVISALKEQKTLEKGKGLGLSDQLTFAEKMADKIADVGGSWSFIISFAFFILFWMGFNSYYLFKSPIDPYPFIFLNLILSCLAAVQAPVIMMSQKRQEERDREYAKNDYMINLQSELEIRLLHEKIDSQVMQQQNELLAVQKAQIDMIDNIIKLLQKNDRA